MGTETSKNEHTNRIVTLKKGLFDLPSREYIVIDFFSKTCGPCKRIRPEYEKLSAEYTSKDILFMVADLDNPENQKLFDQYDTTDNQLIPFFVILKNGKLLSTKQTSKKDELKAWFKSTIEK